MNLKRVRNQNGITLIALVITIIVLLILAAVTIGALTGDNGILSNATRAKRDTEIAEIIEQIRLDIYAEMANNGGAEPTVSDIERIASNYGGITGTEYDDKILTTTEGNYKIKLSDIWPLGDESEDPPISSDSLQPGEIATSDKNEYYDEESDKPDVPAKIPEGFTVSNVTGETTINGGLVIYYIPEGTDTSGDFWTADSDGDGSPDVQENYDQYVWIPVDGILGEDGNIDDVNAENVEDRKILLGRYVFDSNGNIDTANAVIPETLGEQLKTSSSSSDYYTEDTTGRGNSVATGENGIDSFIKSVRENHGYYMGRYEAGNNNDSLVVQKGKSVYVEVTQIQASDLCQNLYTDVKSDLINSYAWDTAILFIQKYSGNSNYSRQIGNSTTGKIALTGKGLLANTNDFDKECNIYNMAGNCYEWSTETYSHSGNPCVHRGGDCTNTSHYTSRRSSEVTPIAYSNVSFRSLLYL